MVNLLVSLRSPIVTGKNKILETNGLNRVRCLIIQERLRVEPLLFGTEWSHMRWLEHLVRISSLVRLFRHIPPEGGVRDAPGYAEGLCHLAAPEHQGISPEELDKVA